MGAVATTLRAAPYVGTCSMLIWQPPFRRWTGVGVGESGLIFQVIIITGQKFGRRSWKMISETVFAEICWARNRSMFRTLIRSAGRAIERRNEVVHVVVVVDVVVLFDHRNVYVVISSFWVNNILFPSLIFWWSLSLSLSLDWKFKIVCSDNNSWLEKWKFECSNSVGVISPWA